MQYEAGVYRISSWADLITVHTLPGPALVRTLASVGQPLGRGCLLLAELSCKPNLITSTYTEESVKMAHEFPEFVAGFICSGRLQDNDAVVWITPGVALECSGDGMGQQYRTVESVVVDGQSDVIVVGRAIYGDRNNWKKLALEFQNSGWNSYQKRTKNISDS